MLSNLLLGWWSKKGLFYTPFILLIDFIKIFRVESESAEIINNFITENTGLLRLYQDKKITLEKILDEFNLK